MESIIILLLLGLFILVVVLPIAAFVRTGSTRDELRQLQQQVVELSRQVHLLSARGEPAPSDPMPPITVEEALAQTLPAVPILSAAPAASELIPQDIPEVVSSARTPFAIPPKLPTEPVAPPTFVIPPSPPRLPLPPKPVFNWERFLGTQLIAWLGGLVLFLAVAYFVKYSFENNLVPPEVRISVGFLLGIGLLLGGFVMKKKAFEVTAQTLCGTGVVSLYAVTFAAHSIYHFPLFGPLVTFGLMCLITATAFLLAIRMNALVVAVLGMLGGFLTPVLLSTGQDNPVGLFGYIALLDIGLIAVALMRPWPFLVALGALGTVIMQIGWTAKFLVPEKLMVPLVTHLGFAALFAAGYEWARRRNQKTLWWPGTLAGIGCTSMVYAIGLLFDSHIGWKFGWLGSILLAGDLCLLFVVWRRPVWSVLQLVGASLANLFLVIWMLHFLTPASLFWVLGGVFLFTLLHTLYPVFLAQVRPEARVARWAHLFPPLAVLLMVMPVMSLPHPPIWIWPLILIVDLLAIALAVFTRSLLSVMAVLMLTAGVGVSWIFRVPAQVESLPILLLILGVMAVVFLFGGMFAMRRILQSQPEAREKSGSGASEEWMVHLPALSAVMPFVLLILVTAQLPLPRPSPVFALGLALSILLLSVARTLGQHVLSWVGLLGGLGLQFVWHGKGLFRAENGPLLLGWHIAFSLVFFLFPFLFRSDCLKSALPWAAAALSLPLHFRLFYQVIDATWPNGYMGALPALLSLPLLGGLLQLKDTFGNENPHRNTVLAWFGGAALFFITLIFPIQWERQWITVSWALEGAALCWLFHRVPHPGLRWVGVGLLCTAFIRLAINPAVLEYHARSTTPIFNWYLYSYGWVIVALFLGARLLAPPNDRLGRVACPMLLITLGTVLAFLLMNIEIADYFTAPGQKALAFSFSGNFARDMTYTIAWSLFALGLVASGIRWNLRAARYSGLALMGIALGKLFLHDLNQLGPPYRIGALAGVAVVAIVFSILYQRFMGVDPRRETSPPSSPPTS